MLKKLVVAVLILIVVVGLGLTAFWFSRPADVSFDELKATIPHSESSKFADVGGVRIHYQEKGSGVPMVLIHGFASSVYTWKDEFDVLAQKYHVIAVDLKGFGFSAKPDGDYTRHAQGELVAGLLDQLKIDKAWIVGNSMGGETALNVAISHPDKVLGLVLIDSAGVKVAGSSSLSPWYLQIPAVGRLLTALAMTSDRLVRKGLETSFYDDSKISDDRVAFYYQPLRTSGGQLAVTRAKEQFDLLPIEDKLSTINVPTLIIWGAEDELIPLEAGKRINSLIKGSKIVILDKCGHVPQEEKPKSVINEIENFVN